MDTVQTSQTVQTSSFTWRKLLNVAAAGEFAVLLFLFVARQDTLAAVLSLIVLAGLALLRVRSGILGLPVLALVFADVMVWTVSGAVSNFLYGDDWLDLMLPATLGLLAMAGLAAAVAGWFTRRDPQRGAQAARRLGKVTVGALAFVLFLSVLIEQRPVQAAQPTDITLYTSQMQFSHTELVAESGEITLHLVNEDLWWHTFTIEELGVDLKVPMGAERSVTFTAEPGTYHFVCTIPGHDQIGMHGVLVVK